MKKRFLVLLSAIALMMSGCGAAKDTNEAVLATATATPTSEATVAPSLSPMAGSGQPMSYYLSLEPEICQPFTLEDWTFCGLPFQAGSADVIAVIGEPDSTETVEWDADGSIYDYHYYDFGELCYQADKLEIIKVSLPGYPGPRGIEVGDSLEDVMKKFCTTFEKYDEDTIILYRQNSGRDNLITIPPSGELWNGEAKTLQFLWDEENKYADEDIAEVEGYIIYETNYSFSMHFDENDRMTDYTLYYGPGAE